MSANAKRKAAAVVCTECPWRKVGRVGIYYPEDQAVIFDLVDAGTPMSCHMTLTAGRARDCRGLETYRANVGLPSPCKPDTVTVVANRREALRVWPSALERIFLRVTEDMTVAEVEPLLSGDG